MGLLVGPANLKLPSRPNVANHCLVTIHFILRQPSPHPSISTAPLPSDLDISIHSSNFLQAGWLLEKPHLRLELRRSLQNSMIRNALLPWFRKILQFQ